MTGSLEPFDGGSPASPAGGHIKVCKRLPSPGSLRCHSFGLRLWRRMRRLEFAQDPRGYGRRFEVSGSEWQGRIGRCFGV